MENIEVGLRVRPLSQTERSLYEKNPWVILPNNSLYYDMENYEHFLKGIKSSQINLSHPINFSILTKKILIYLLKITVLMKTSKMMNFIDK